MSTPWDTITSAMSTTLQAAPFSLAAGSITIGSRFPASWKRTGAALLETLPKEVLSQATGLYERRYPVAVVYRVRLADGPAGTNQKALLEAWTEGIEAAFSAKGIGDFSTVTGLREASVETEYLDARAETEDGEEVAECSQVVNWDVWEAP